MAHEDKRMWIQNLWKPIEQTQSILNRKAPDVRVAAYCRTSLGVNQSLENQVNHYTLLIKNNPNWRFVGIYFDENVSGANSRKRRGLQRLLRHAREGRLDMIIAKSVSRLSRNSKELMEMVDQLKELGVGVLFEQENIDTSVDYNRFLLNTYAALAQEEVETISQSTEWAFEKQFLEGKPFFHSLLGYDAVTKNGRKTLAINEIGARAVRMIFDLFLSGKSLTEIARQLMRQGIKTSVGKDFWTGGAVKNILTNFTYTGNKLTRVKTKDIFTQTVKSNIRDQILIENTHPAIISDATFQRAQQRFKKRKQRNRPTKPTTKNALSRRLKCARCHRNFILQPSDGGLYWKCGSRAIGVCETPSLNESVILEMMIEAVRVKYRAAGLDILVPLRRELQWVNNHDHFEFHRLKFLTQIELAEKQIAHKADSTDIVSPQKLRQDYRDFEKSVELIEDDREYRMEALEWLDQLVSAADFWNEATPRYLRALILRMEIYSRNDYRVSWVDGSQTVVGNFEDLTVSCREERIVSDKEKRDQENTVSGELTNDPIETGIEDVYTFQVINQDGSICGEDCNTMNTNPQVEVITVEPNPGNIVMANLLERVSGGQSSKMPKTLLSQGRERLRTAAYCRVSTDLEEQELSFKTQVAYYTYLILKNPEYEYAGIYADKGISGTSLKNRNEFLRLIADCKDGKVDLILVKSVSRFSRNLMDALSTIRMLKSLKRPVYVYFEKENIHTKDEKSDLMLTIMGSIAQEESINMGESMAWGKRRYAERGIVKNSNISYGYEADQYGNWSIVEEEARVVKRIFDATLEGKTSGEICQELTREGVASPGGAETWGVKTVLYILRNEVYRGNYLYQKYYTKDPLEKKTARNRGELPQYFIENHHEAIISSDEWEETQSLLEQRIKTNQERSRKKHPEQTSKNIAFENFFKCGECGGLFGHRRYFFNSHENNGWVCNEARRPYAMENCTIGRIQQRYIELHFMRMLVEVKREPKFKREMEDWLAQTELNPEEQRQIEKIKQDIECLSQQLYLSVSEEIDKPGRDAKEIDKITGQIVALQNELRDYSNRAEGANLFRQEINWLGKQLEDIDEESIMHFDCSDQSQSVPFRVDVFSRFFDGGTIFKDGRISYTLKNGLEWSTDFRYEEYKRLVQAQKAACHRAKKEKFLKGPEVEGLLKYCTEARSMGEMLEFMNARTDMSESHFRVSVLTPLLDVGKLARLYQGYPSHPKQRYYSPKYNKVYSDDATIAKGEYSEDNIALVAREVVLDPAEVKRILKYCRQSRSRRELQAFLGMKDRNHVRKRILNPLIHWGMLKYTNPENPSDKQQKYYSDME